MRSTLDITNIVSVLSTFSWDSSAYNAFPLAARFVNGIETYIGYAPLVQVLLSSVPYEYDTSAAYHVRAVNFGDYYNTASNVINISGNKIATFSHSYVMPGLYMLSMSEAEYSNIDALTYNDITLESNPDLVWTDYTGISATTINGQTLIPNVTALVTESNTIQLSVVEIFPTAYLSSNIPFNQADIVFPLTVTITPKFTQTGSFPIEKIVWDLGDGSPLITRRRWDANAASPFIHTNALSADSKDPRNYDIVHTYTKPSAAVYNFYPSITAYASSTGSKDSCSITIGPIISPTFKDSKTPITLLQTTLNENGAAVLGQIGSDIGIWKMQ